MVNWLAHTLAFPPVIKTSSLETTSPDSPPDPASDLSSPPSISLIGAATFTRAVRLPGSQTFRLCLRTVSPDTSSVPEEPPDLFNVPPEYHDFADIFSDAKAKTLAPHRLYDLKIELEEDKPILPGPIYLLSPAELQALRKFIDENLNAGFICQSTSLHGAPVLFVKKKDGSL